MLKSYNENELYIIHSRYMLLNYVEKNTLLMIRKKYNVCHNYSSMKTP